MGKLSCLLLVIVVLTGGSVGAEDWQVGQTWTFQHEGPRPYGDALSTVEGDRVVTVTAIKGTGKDKRYLVKNTWGKNDPTPATSYIDQDALIHQIDLDALGLLQFKPPVPAFWKALKVGEKKVLKATMTVSGFALALEYTVKRLMDEVVKVPAGSFKDCVHFQVISKMDNPMGGGVSQSKADQWYHPQVKYFVKEKVVSNFQADNSYTATSVLKSYRKGD